MNATLTAMDLLSFRLLSGYRDVNFRVQFKRDAFASAVELIHAFGEAGAAAVPLRAKPSRAKLLMPLRFTTVSIQAIEPHEGTARGTSSQRGLRVLGVVALVVCGLVVLAAAARTDRAVAEPWISAIFCALIIGAPIVTLLAMAGIVRGNIALRLLDAFRGAPSIESVADRPGCESGDAAGG